MAISKTPQFDAALDAYYRTLILDEHGGQWRVCRFSGEKFYVRPEDITFYRRMQLPLPTLSPKERIRRRHAYTNTYHLFRVSSAFSGKKVIAVYPPNTPYKIYEHQVWFSDEWNPMEYGVGYDAGKDLFAQLHDLFLKVPRPNLITDTTNVNSDFTNASTHLKNCYLTFETLSGENLQYFVCCDKSKDCVDCESLWRCDRCYGSQYLEDSFRCFFVEQSRSCIDSYFLYDCRNCEKCFMSANLRNKKYYFFGAQLTKEEYEEKMRGFSLGSFNVLCTYLAQFEELKKNAVYKPNHNNRAVGGFGDYIENSKDCFFVYFVYDSERVNYSMGLAGYTDTFDVLGGINGQLCYESILTSMRDNYGVKFSVQTDNCRDMEYCDLCRNSRNCFGCVGLSNKSFCIFNKQYSEAEYWDTIDTIKTNMLKSGEYGEFFPPSMATVPYRISIDASYPGFNDFSIPGKYGYDVTEIEFFSDSADRNVVSSKDLPDDIVNVEDSILEKNIYDEKNKKYFRLTPYELDFYRREKIALPREHPLVRLAYFRKVYLLGMETFERTCPVCGVSFVSFYDPKDFKNVYCEECYQKEVA